jgi:hypothetical protein
MRLDKQKSRQRINEIRFLWREWDPIGVYVDPKSNWPPDEYDSYLAPCLRQLKQQVSAEVLAKYLASIAGEHMGLGDPVAIYPDALLFARKLQAWFSSAWDGTHV